VKELHSTAAGVIFLHGYKAQPVNAGGRRYAFELTPTDHELKHFFFHAQTETEKKRYVRVQRASMSKRKAVVFLVQCPRKCTNFQESKLKLSAPNYYNYLEERGGGCECLFRDQVREREID
jgi:hypothetical protein